MKILATYILLIISGTLILNGQVITITDSEDNKPLQGVAVLNTERTEYYISDKNGKVNISPLIEYDEICFHHFTYEFKCLTFDEIKKSGYSISLKRKIFEIEEFVISARRWEQKRIEIPNRIATIPGPVIAVQNPQTSADLIGLTGEVFIQKSQLGGGSPMIRGFATNRVLIVVDGVRMNNAIYREGNIQNIISVDPLSVESSEVIFGPGAVVYGSDAIGGVMDFHTTKPLLSTTDSLMIKADVFSRYSSANNEKTFHAGFNAGKKKIAYAGSVSISGFSDLRMGSHGDDSYLRNEYATRLDSRDTIIQNPDPLKQIFSGYSQVNALNKLRVKLSSNHDLIIGNIFSRISDVPRYDRLIQYRNGSLRFGDWYYGPQEWVLSYADFTANSGSKLFDRLKIIVSHQHYSESRHDRTFGSNNLNSQKENVGIAALNIDFDKKLSKKGSMIFYGAEAVINDIKSTAQTTDIITGTSVPAGPRYPDGINRYSSASVYGGYKTSSDRKAGLTAGLRYNYVGLHSEIEDNSFYGFPFTTISISNGSLTGSAGLVFRLNEDTRVGVNLSTGFRAPNLDDAGKVFESAPGIVVVPNPGLRPEYAYNSDISISKNFGEVFHAEVSAFYTFLNNALIRHDFLFNGSDSIIYQGISSKVEALTNSGYAISYGLHLKAQANITSEISCKSSLVLNDGHEQGNIPLRHVAPLFGSTHLLFKKGGVEADLYMLYNGAKPFEKIAPSEISKPYIYATDKNGKPWSPGWSTLNLKFSYNHREFLSFTAGIENMLDKRYRPYSSGIVAPGRNFIFSVRLKI